MTIFSFDLTCIRLFFVKCLREGSTFNHFIYYENHKSCVNFCIVNTPRCQVLIWMCKVFCIFQQTFAREKVKVNIMKRQKTSALKHFSLPRYSKKWTPY